MSEVNDTFDFAVPAFAVVGKVNTGKSSVLATLLELDDERVLRISSTPGETTRAQRLALKVGEEERLLFLDTPGFSDAVGAMREIQAIHGSGLPNLESVRKFVRMYEGGEKFADECLLLAPVVAGAGVLYVVDSSKPLKERYLAEMEILRWTGRPRMAVMNPQEHGDASQQHMAEWRTRLGSLFNLVKTFDAHSARYAERIGMLNDLKAMDEVSAKAIAAVVRSLEDKWVERREKAVDLVMDFYADILTLQRHKAVDEELERSERRMEQAQEELRAEWMSALRKRERKLLGELLALYKHGRVDATEVGVMEVTDLEAEETWRKWGLNRKQLVAAGAATGGGLGIMVDIGTGGLTHGWGTLIGSGVGALGAFFGGDELPDVEFDLRKGSFFKQGGAKSLEVGAPKSDQFPFVMLDSILSAYRGILEWTHARRDAGEFSADGKSGRVNQFGRQRNNDLAKWFGLVRKGKSDRELGEKVFVELCAILEEVQLE